MKWSSHLHRAILIFFLLHYVVRFRIICTLHGSEAIFLSLRAFVIVVFASPDCQLFVFFAACRLFRFLFHYVIYTPNWHKSDNEGQ